MNHVIISRVDNIGDVALTLPVAGVLKKLYPHCKISFFAKKYTKPLIDASENINDFIDWESILAMPKKSQLTFFRSLKADAIIHVFPNRKISRLAFLAKIPVRAGTSRRTHHLLYCNKIINLSRKKSDLHESQLNLGLLSALGIKNNFLLSDIPSYYGLSVKEPAAIDYQNLIDPCKFNLILHPKSKGSAREWGLANFSALIEILPKDKFKIFITGTSDEGKIISGFLEKYQSEITDLTGKFDLRELIGFINSTDGMVAASTGPLHIAAALGKYALGIYAPMKPIYPKRWAPVGLNAEYLVLDKKCNDCRKTKDCVCIRSIKPENVLHRLNLAYEKNSRISENF
ncbi:MAG: glycosyltransferase family 9 protein [Bacteroidia bacterium]|nr:glycosyltransferase family 9 protein [Bacteroidia bacterium]